MDKWISPTAVGFAAALLAAAATGAAARAAESASDKRAAELFASTCGFCHENGGRVAGKGPKLAGTARSDAFIVNRIKEGKEGAMPAFDGALTNSQIKGIVHYIRNLKSE
jgi:mono/diheme cytochrome c family protein